MTVKPRHAFWLAVCAAAVSLPLFGLLRSPLAPSLLAIAEFAWRLYGALPPTVLWLGLILVLYLLAALGWLTLALNGFLRLPWRAPVSPVESEGRVAALTRWVKRRRRGPFSRHYLKQRVSEIAIEKLAQAHRASPAQIKAALEAHALDLPPEISAYLLAGLLPWPAEPLSAWRDLAGWLGLSRLAAPPGEDATERVLDYLEAL